MLAFGNYLNSNTDMPLDGIFFSHQTIQNRDIDEYTFSREDQSFYGLLSSSLFMKMSPFSFTDLGLTGLCPLSNRQLI